jgi:hypothetical protein
MMDGDMMGCGMISYVNGCFVFYDGIAPGQKCLPKISTFGNRGGFLVAIRMYTLELFTVQAK